MKKIRPAGDSIEAREHRFARRSMLLAFGGGLLLASVASAGLVGERLWSGSVRAALFVNVVVLCVGIVAMSLTARALNVFFASAEVRRGSQVASRLRSSAILLPQLVGASCGITLVHFVLSRSGASQLGWMRETPLQFMNDAVAALGTLSAVWACASRRLRLELLGVTLLGLLLYGATRNLWHVDRPPAAFQASIQVLVVAQVIAAATGLLAYRRFSPV